MTVSLAEAARTGLTTKYASFSGRARRSEYWWFSIIYVAGAGIAGVLAAVLEVPAVALVAIILMVPMLAVSVRRLHDRGRSGWGILINLVPVVGTVLYLIGMAQEGDPAANRYGDPV